ncbi:MAG: response regulator [Pirellulaceae bacterium]|nr:response regulator [Pirellulaceae bacterium]
MLKRNFNAETVEAATASETLERLAREKFDLVLVNRKLDHDYSDGIEIIKLIKSQPELATIPVMLITNSPDHQELAVAAGALPGFGKLELNTETTHQRLAAVFTGAPAHQS